MQTTTNTTIASLCMQMWFIHLLQSNMRLCHFGFVLYYLFFFIYTHITWVVLYTHTPYIHIHCTDIKSEIRNEYLSSTVLGEKFIALLCFLIFFLSSSCLDSKGAVKTPPHIDQYSAKQNILTDTHLWGGQKKPAWLLLTWLASWVFWVSAVMKELLSEKYPKWKQTNHIQNIMSIFHQDQTLYS